MCEIITYLIPYFSLMVLLVVYPFYGTIYAVGFLTAGLWTHEKKLCFCVLKTGRGEQQNPVAGSL